MAKGVPLPSRLGERRKLPQRDDRMGPGSEQSPGRKWVFGAFLA